jgi:CRISPR-associated protein Cas2
MAIAKNPNLILVYDIPDDRKRTKIADTCLDYGLDRIQYSAFTGWLLPAQQEELFLKLKKILGKKAGNIQLFPICADDWRKRKVFEQSEPPSSRSDREAKDA